MGQPRLTVGTAGMVFHVMNRGVRRWRLFDSDEEYQTCLVVLAAALQRYPADLLAYCLMPNHFHLLVRPTVDGQLSRLMQWFTATHSRRWHLGRGSRGTGSVYQGRFKAFPVQTDDHFLTVCRYVERNPLRASLVARAEDWPWSSLAERARSTLCVPLASWPVARPSGWAELLNDAEPQPSVMRIRESVSWNVPFGAGNWAERVANALHLSAQPRRPGRPRRK